MATATKTKPVVNLFAAAKKVETKIAKSKDKDQVTIEGYQSQIDRYNEIKGEEKNLAAEKEMLAGELKEIGKMEFLKKYEQQKSKPESFYLESNGSKILLIVQDAYKKVEEAKEAALEQYDVLETKQVFTINPEILGRCAEAVSKAIMNSKDLSADDKANLILCTETKFVKKGTIDCLLTFNDHQQVFALIEPIIALK